MSWEDFLSDKLRSKQYHNKGLSKKDILNVLRAYGDLHPDEDTYVHTDGSTQHLICLRGTIPVNYKGSMYNIPVQIWLLLGHPFTAPYVYVKPTSSMVVKPTKNVDQAGRVYSPYLTEWRSPKSDTYGLINMLCMIFSQECPVYAKPTIVPPVHPPNPRPAYNYSGGPGYPTHSNMPMPGMPSPYGSNVPSHHSGGGMPSHTGYPLQYSSPSNTITPPYSTQPTPYPNIYRPTTSGSYQPATSSYQTPTSSYQTPTSSYQTPTSSYQQPTIEALTGKTPSREGSVIADATIRASLLSSVEDKLKRRVKEVFQMGKLEIETLEKTKFDLVTGNRELQDMVSQMNDEEANLNSNISLLRQKNEEVEEVLKKLEKDSENMNIDEAVVTTAPLYNQILSLFAEENAVEDAIYYLTNALGRGVIELEVFLKTVRSLSRRQFMLRATLQKARSTAGLTSSLMAH